MKNTFGSAVSLTIFGESHGPAIGAVLDGLAAGLPVDAAQIAACMDRRRARGDGLSTSRTEPDQVEFVSGLLESAALESWLRLVILLAVFVAVGFLALKFVRPVMILATGFSGASSILSSLLLMGVAIPAGLVQLAVMLVLAAVGIGVQFATTR